MSAKWHDWWTRNREAYNEYRRLYNKNNKEQNNTTQKRYLNNIKKNNPQKYRAMLDKHSDRRRYSRQLFRIQCNSILLRKYLNNLKICFMNQRINKILLYNCFVQWRRAKNKRSINISLLRLCFRKWKKVCRRQKQHVVINKVVKCIIVDFS